MSTLAWRQTEDLQLELYIPGEEGTLIFEADLAVINFLVSVRSVDFYVRLQGKGEKLFKANFKRLKPVPEKVKDSISRNIADHSADTPGHYFAISRGETFSNRWLTPNAWGDEQHWFEMKFIRIEGRREEALPAKETAHPPVAVQENVKPAKSVAETLISRAGASFVVLIVSFVLSMVLYLICLLIMMYSGEHAASRMLIIPTILLIVTLASSAFSMLHLIFLGWKILIPQGGRGNPEVAVWLLLIPVFNMFWAFTAIRGLFVEFNRVYRELNPGLDKRLLSPKIPTVMIIFWIHMFLWLLFSLIVFNTSGNPGIPTVACVTMIPFMILCVITGNKINSAIGKMSRSIYKD